ncbi:MAG: type I restriction endonuclease [Leptolyngbyaceae bacterium]|nr:type I restriction endonuclease [Leptolyngbyaceae bacterium]
MLQTTAITEAITTLAEAENRFQLRRAEEEQFFPEWWEELPALTGSEKTYLDEIRHRYLYHRVEGNLLEGTVTLLVASPLLTIAGFYDAPFRMQAEASVQITLNDGEEVLRGRIDVLVLQKQFWIVILESKKTTLSVWSAIPQALAYLMANPHPDRPSFGMVTNGDDIVFVKLTQTGTPQYAFSRAFALLSTPREIEYALQILKRIGQVMT